jgi:hypothetical protein
MCVCACVLCTVHAQALFRRAQLKALVGLHSSAEGLGGNLSADEISIITGALDLTSKTACTAMTPLDKVRKGVVSPPLCCFVGLQGYGRQRWGLEQTSRLACMATMPPRLWVVHAGQHQVHPTDPTHPIGSGNC